MYKNENRYQKLRREPSRGLLPRFALFSTDSHLLEVTSWKTPKLALAYVALCQRH